MVIKRAYPDTPVAMHYRPFEDIDWCKLLGADQVVLVITPVFLREIDEHKDHKRGALQQRARRMNTWLADLRRTKNWTIRTGVRVEVNAREPERDLDFAAHGLEPSINDDKIVACMLRDAKTAPDTPLVCVTSDNALGFKADAAGFEVVAPPDEMRVAEEPDQAEREKRQLQQKLVELQKRIEPAPDLAVHFVGGEDHVTVNLSGLEEPAEEDFDEEIEAERSGLDMRHRFLPLTTHRPPKAKAVERYLQDLRAWMVKHKRGAIMRAHTFDLELMLANAGIGNASDIEIDLTFPDAVFAAETRTLPDVEERPTPPKPEDVYSALTIAKVKPFTYPRLDVRPVRLREPIRIDDHLLDPHRVRVLVDRAKHQANVVLPTFQAWFEVGRLQTGFSIDYRIHAASTPEIKTGALHVKVDVREGPFRFFRS